MQSSFTLDRVIKAHLEQKNSLSAQVWTFFLTAEQIPNGLVGEQKNKQNAEQDLEVWGFY